MPAKKRSTKLVEAAIEYTEALSEVFAEMQRDINELRARIDTLEGRADGTPRPAEKPATRP